MPANLTPQYRAAEEEYRAAVTPEEKLRWLQEMIRLLPKHKGTDHLYGDLKRRLAKLKTEGRRKAAGARQTPAYYIPHEGAGQVILLGAPNVGKSSIVGALTRARVEVAEYPFTTHTTVPGMMEYKDIKIQLIDTPPMSADYMESWMPDVVRRADAAVVVADLGTDAALEQAEAVMQRLEEASIFLCEDIPEARAEGERRTLRRALMAANKADLPDAGERLEVLRELYGPRLPVLGISAATGAGLEEFRGRVFEMLHVIRVYTRAPGRKDDLGDPFALPCGSTLLDLAEAIHKELAENIKQARIWGTGVYDGQYVKLDHVLSDGDIVELHE